MLIAITVLYIIINKKEQVINGSIHQNTIMVLNTDTQSTSKI